MTTRERWTVYPLVFLSLGLSMRAVLVPHGEFETVRAGRLEADEVEAGRVICREWVEAPRLPSADGDRRMHNLRPDDGGKERPADAASARPGSEGTLPDPRQP